MAWRAPATRAFALFAETEGDFNTANGVQALFSNTTGHSNTATGNGALFTNTEGNFNTASGVGALFSSIAGQYNTAIGHNALRSNTTGVTNTAIGHAALDSNTTGEGNTALGNGAGINVTTASNVTCIHHPGEDVSNTTWISDVYARTTEAGTTLPVIVSVTGQLGTTPSSRRFKKEIKAMDKVSAAILALKPVTFHYKRDKKDTPQFGLIAEKLAAVNPDLVVRDKEGKPYSVRYDQVNAMLLNEFLKEHRKVEKLEATVADLAEIVKKQANELQRVGAQVQMNSSVAKVANK